MNEAALKKFVPRLESGVGQVLSKSKIVRESFGLGLGFIIMLTALLVYAAPRLAAVVVLYQILRMQGLFG